MKRKTIAMILAAVDVVLALAVVVAGLRFVHSRKSTPDVGADANPYQVLSVSVGTEEDAPTETRNPAVDPTATTEPTAMVEPTATPSATPWPGPDVPDQGQDAPAGYFSDAAFLGNSLVSGLDLYDYDDTLSGAVFYADNSVTVLGIADYVAQMAGTQYGKVYVGLGTNEMSYDHTSLRQAFNNLIDQLQANNPGCIIYLMAVTPVSEYKSTTNQYFTQDLVLDFNAMLREIAEERQVWYLDVFTPLADEQGFLPSDVTVDGVHFTPAHYANWFAYLQTHFISDSKT